MCKCLVSVTWVILINVKNDLIDNYTVFSVTEHFHIPRSYYNYYIINYL